MTTPIPHELLAKALQASIDGWKLHTAVFLTFSLEPDFFEQEVLPVLLDAPLSQAPSIRLVQLEDALRAHDGHLAVYYDAGALCATGPPRLDVRYIPVRRRTGYFHPKNVLALIEHDGERRLVVACLSANLTRAGWWENVEVCHIERFEHGEKTMLRGDLLDLVKGVRRDSPAGVPHAALDDIQAFVRRLDTPGKTVTGGLLRPRLYTGAGSVSDFLDEASRGRLRGRNLEIISPYFDDRSASPLQALIDRFEPPNVRVCLPRRDDGAAECTPAYYDDVAALPGTQWGRLEGSITKMGAGNRTKRRGIHAKVYRFFGPDRYEAFFVGSANLTTAAHQAGGNFESGFLVETSPSTDPTWWLEPDRNRPDDFQPRSEGEETHQGPGAALAVRYDWSDGRAEAYWDASEPSPELRLFSAGVEVLIVPPLPPREWQPFSTDQAAQLRTRLQSTAFLDVRIEGAPSALIIVAQEGMAHKPSLLFALSAVDILRYWALLTPEQRAAFLEERMSDLLEASREIEFVDHAATVAELESFFDQFAGIFHAFGRLEETVRTAIKEGRLREVEYRLLGKKYDSLPRLVDRVLDEEATADPIKAYLILLCAQQLLAEVEVLAPDFAHAHRRSLREIRDKLAKRAQVRSAFSFGTPDERNAFFGWFERWFLRRAQPMEPRP